MIHEKYCKTCAELVETTPWDGAINENGDWLDHCCVECGGTDLHWPEDAKLNGWFDNNNERLYIGDDS